MRLVIGIFFLRLFANLSLYGRRGFSFAQIVDILRSAGGTRV